MQEMVFQFLQKEGLRQDEIDMIQPFYIKAKIIYGNFYV